MKLKTTNNKYSKPKIEVAIIGILELGPCCPGWMSNFAVIGQILR